MPMHRTGFVFDERYLRHDTGAQSTVRMRIGSFETSPEGHPSSTGITRRIKEFLDGSGLTAMMHPIPARAASEDELAVYHKARASYDSYYFKSGVRDSLRAEVYELDLGAILFTLARGEDFPVPPSGTAAAGLPRPAPSSPTSLANVSA